jgi:Transposase.
MGRIERTLFILNWLQSVELRRQANAGSAFFSALGGAAPALVGLCVLGTCLRQVCE